MLLANCNIQLWSFDAQVHPWFMDKVRQQQLPQLLLRQLVQQLLSRQDVKQEYVSSSDIGSWMACVKEYCPLLLYRQVSICESMQAVHVWSAATVQLSTCLCCATAVGAWTWALQ